MNIYFEDATLHKNEIKKLYRSAFPIEERAPLFVLFKRHRQNRAKFSAVLDENKFVGLTFVSGVDNVQTLMFLAIKEEYRNKGYGTKILREILCRTNGEKLFLNIEPIVDGADNIEQRLKRKEFYLKNGMKELDYTVQEFNVEYEMLSYNGYIKKEEYKAVMKNIFGKTLFSIMTFYSKLHPITRG